MRDIRPLRRGYIGNRFARAFRLQPKMLRQLAQAQAN
jgi:hypothetical protein